VFFTSFDRHCQCDCLALGCSCKTENACSPACYVFRPLGSAKPCPRSWFTELPRAPCVPPGPWQPFFFTSLRPAPALRCVPVDQLRYGYRHASHGRVLGRLGCATSPMRFLALPFFHPLLAAFHCVFSFFTEKPSPPDLSVIPHPQCPVRRYCFSVGRRVPYHTINSKAGPPPLRFWPIFQHSCFSLSFPPSSVCLTTRAFGGNSFVNSFVPWLMGVWLWFVVLFLSGPFCFRFFLRLKPTPPVAPFSRGLIPAASAFHLSNVRVLCLEHCLLAGSSYTFFTARPLHFHMPGRRARYLCVMGILIFFS